MKKLEVIKPLRMNQYLLNVGDQFEVAKVIEDPLTKAKFWRPANVKGMEEMYWLFSTKIFKVIA
tara:strand:+ start:3892 stop:4083 length:192 start_codon:yes stop_codon:yes gene_type:complete